MTIKLGVVMDPMANIHYKKDSTLAMLWEATRRGWDIFYIEQKDLFLKNNTVFANTKKCRVFKNPEKWFETGETDCIPLRQLDVILMRKDPPFNMEYIYTTYLLELAERAGVRVINKPQALRDVNEKLFTAWFPDCCPKTLVSCDMRQMRDFLQEEKDVVCKPLNAMGGEKIFRLSHPDENASAVFETLTQNGREMAMMQRYIPQIKQGDKRILMINGEPVSHALARIPKEGELRGNLAAGGRGIAQPLSERDREICQQVGPVLREKGLYFVGLDVIGDYLTEINVTSPTCIRELDDQTGSNISMAFFNCIAELLSLS
ncbi:MAG TPA: glutathione synthase [Gammaproteobacteria bacterium]|nr:glutathione synthase [Gammaproteobacteria bacterium]